MIKLINLSNYVRPELIESKQKNWVLNGKDMSFYDYIIDRQNGSPTNSSINNSYISLIYGRGLDYKNGLRGVNDWAKLQTILRPKELRKIITDFQIFGEFSMQVTETRGKELSTITHIAKQKVAPSIEDEEGEINSYWFCKDWKRKYQNQPEEYPAFGLGGNTIYVAKPYRVGKSYYSDPDYLAGLPYCEMEEEIANLNVNYIKAGLSAGYIINVPDGYDLTPEEKEDFERKIKAKLTGSPNAGQFVLNFASRDADQITVTVFPVNERIHKQWEFLTEEAKKQIMVSHRVTSPSLVGLSAASGFSSVADEMDMSEKQLYKRVIQPKQDFIIEALEDVLVQYGINLDLYFKPLTEEAEIPVEMSKHVCMSDDDGATEDMANTLIQFGEDESDEWDLLCSSDVDYETDDDLFGLLEFAKTGTARPNANSLQDSEDIKIRYRYAGNPAPQRLFCQLMMASNKLYRKEDILQMEKSSTNPGFGKGTGGASPYSIWLWKGGGKMSTAHPNGTCRHKWQREIYLKRGGGVDVNSPLAKTISTSEARRKGYKVPVNNPNVGLTPNKNVL